MFLASLASSLKKTAFPCTIFIGQAILIKIAKRFLVLLEGDYIVCNNLVVFNSAEGLHFCASLLLLFKYVNVLYHQCKLAAQLVPTIHQFFNILSCGGTSSSLEMTRK